MDTRNFFFNQRVENSGNSLPAEVENAVSVNGFENAYDRWCYKDMDDISSPSTYKYKYLNPPRRSASPYKFTRLHFGGVCQPTCNVYLSSNDNRLRIPNFPNVQQQTKTTNRKQIHLTV